MYFFSKTNNPRPTFHLDKSDEEKAIMQKHTAYWSEMAARGVVIVLGPVMDPQGVYGIIVCQVRDEAEMQKLIEHDPANGLLRYEVLPMPRAIIGAPAS